MKDDRLYLSNIKECIERIKSYTVDGKETFLQMPIVQDAVIRNFEIIGEATKRLSAELRAAYPEIQWQQIAGFRDVLIHDIFKSKFESSMGCDRARFTWFKTDCRDDFARVGRIEV